jgi:hypothetical protein
VEPADANDQQQGGNNDGVPDVFTVDDAVEYLGFGRFQLLLALLTGLAWMADAMEIMILSILSPALYCEWGISPIQQVPLSLSLSLLFHLHFFPFPFRL